MTRCYFLDRNNDKCKTSEGNPVSTQAQTKTKITKQQTSAAYTKMSILTSTEHNLKSLDLRLRVKREIMKAHFWSLLGKYIFVPVNKCI